MSEEAAAGDARRLTLDVGITEQVRHLIQRSDYEAAEALVRSCAEDAAQLLLRGEILLERAKYESRQPDDFNAACGILVRALYHRSASQLSRDQRQRLVDLLSVAAETSDPALAALMRGERLPAASRQAADVLKAFYFRGAAQGLTMGERTLAARDRLAVASWPGRTIDAYNYFIEFHKVFSSYTPLLDPARATSLGGGYFLALGSYGCVIDPGHHFLDNFLAHRSLDDVDGIVVTHFHDDHYADLPALLSLLYQRSRSRERRVDLFLDRTTASMFRRPTQRIAYLRRFEVLSADQEPCRFPEGAELRCLPTRHPVFGRNTAVGLVWDIPARDTRLVITGDTGWAEELGEVYRQLRGPRVLLAAHVGSASREEIPGSFLGEQPGYYDKHLGIRGLCRVIESLRPAAVILSEIGEELADSITELADIIQTVYPCRCAVGWRRYQQSFPIDALTW
ncbi:MAG: MBL fold metallo-hydrolase [Verrucomicrobia bacterium]|nr:MBL fold metallo-hydrolase [Verrucomicrobiota bacterium]